MHDIEMTSGDIPGTVSAGSTAGIIQPNTDKTKIAVYPCDRGTGVPLGYHAFAAGITGIVCCRFCGQKPKS